MRKLLLLSMVLCLFCSGSLLADIIYAVDSSRTELNNGSESKVDDVRSDSSKLSVRGDEKAMKSWFEFDISELDVDSLTSAQVRVTLQAGKDSTCLLSAVNDDITSGYFALDGSVTWNTGPGNITSSDGVNPDDTVNFTVEDLQGNLDPTKTTLIDTVEYPGGQAGDQFFVDIPLSILQNDTDGYVLFVLHGAGGNTNFATHDISLGEDYYPALVYETVPVGQCEGVGETIYTFADDSCRTSLYDGSESEADENKEDSSKLSVRGDEKAAKSWIKFDIADLGIEEPNDIKAATLRVTLHEGKSSTCMLSYVNDSYTTNIGWTEADLTWNTGPGNYTSSDGVNPDTGGITFDQLQEELDPTQTTYLQIIDYDGGQTGEQFECDVLEALQGDTDGILQFVLHGAGGSTNFSTHDHPNGEEYWPRLEILVPPAGADNPYPCPGVTVTSDLVGLSWTNPDPNDGVSPITCTVYFGEDPNRPQMDSVTLDPGDNAVLINTTNFETYGNPQSGTTYYWAVDCDDPTAGTIPGMMWDFLVYDNEAPVVDAGTNDVTWLVSGSAAVNLSGTADDDGLPEDPGMLTYTWERTGGPETAIIDPNDQLNTTVTFSEAGDYEFTLTADDGALSGSDSVRIVIGNNPCEASHMFTGADYDDGDVNEDCIVDLTDFVLLIVDNWLDCTNTLTGCN